MPQLDTVTYLSQFFWFCFFFIGYYFSLVQWILPKIARLLKFRQEKIHEIHKRSSYYFKQIRNESSLRWTHYLQFLEIQGNLAQMQVKPPRPQANSIGIHSHMILEKAFHLQDQCFQKKMETLLKTSFLVDSYLTLLPREKNRFFH